VPPSTITAILARRQDGACVECLVRMSELPHEHVRAVVEALVGQQSITKNDGTCPECGRFGSVVRVR
jgi:uncharacterized protein with PIN domain